MRFSFISRAIFPLTALLLLTPLFLQAKMRTIEIEVTVPNPLWSVKIQEVYLSKEKIFVIAQAGRKNGIAPQVISTAKDKIELDLPKLPIEEIILGNPLSQPRMGEPGWAKPVDLRKKLIGAKRVYPPVPKPEKSSD